MVDASSFLKSLASFSIVPIFTALVTLIVIPAVSSIFPADEYGKINIFYSMGALLVTGVMLGLDNSLIRYYFEPPKGMTSGAIFRVAFFTGSIVIIAGCIVVCLFSNAAVSKSLFGEVTPWGVPLLATYTFGLMVLRLLNIDARMKGNAIAYGIQSIAQCVVTRLLFVVVAIWSTYYLCSIATMAVGVLVIAGVCLLVQKDVMLRSDGKLTNSNLRVLVAFGIPVMLTNLVLNLNASIGKFILGGYGLYDAAGVLAIATTLASVFSIIPSAFNVYWSPFMYKNYSDEQGFIMRVHDYVVFCSIVMVIIIVLFQDILFCMVGGDYSSCQMYFMLIMLNPIQMLICETTSYGIFIKEHPIWNTIISGAGVVICGLITLVLAPHMGVIGAVIGIAASSIFIGISRSVVGQRYYLSISSPIKSAVGCVAICFLCGANCIMYTNLPLRFLICGVVFTAALVLYKKEVVSIFKALSSCLARIKK